MVRISVDTGTCVGAAQCVLAAEDLFDQDDDGIVTLLNANPEGEAVKAARVAAESCPSRSITLHED